MQELGRRVWDSKRKSYQIKSSLTKVTGGGAATGYEMNQSSSERGREGPSESRSAKEETLRVIHTHSRPRPEDPERSDNTQQKHPGHQMRKNKIQFPIQRQGQAPSVSNPAESNGRNISRRYTVTPG